MLNSDQQKFETWLSSGLKQPIPGHAQFTKRLMARLDEQQAVILLRRVQRQQTRYRRLTIALILAGLGLLLIPPVSKSLYGFLLSVFAYLIECIQEPTLTGMIIPLAILAAAVTVFWNLIDMVAQE